MDNLKATLPKPIGAFFSLIMALVSIKDFFDTDKEYVSGYLILIAALFFIAFIWLVILIIRDYYIHKAKKEHIGVLFNIDTETLLSFKDTVSKLIEEFCEITNCGKSLCFAPVVIPYQRCKKIKPLSKPNLLDLLERKNCIFYIKVKIKFEEGKQDTLYVMDTSHVVAHRDVDKEYLQILQKEYDYASPNITRTEYNSGNKIPTLYFRAFQLSYLCQYLCGISLCISEQYSDAATILNELYTQLHNDKENIDSVKHLIHHVNVWAYLANVNDAGLLADEYLDTIDVRSTRQDI